MPGLVWLNTYAWPADIKQRAFGGAFPPHALFMAGSWRDMSTDVFFQGARETCTRVRFNLSWARVAFLPVLYPRRASTSYPRQDYGEQTKDR